jgi:predicted acetyltransferase
MSDAYRLVTPDVRYRETFLTMVEDYHRAGEERFYDVGDDFAAYVQRLQKAACGVGLQPGWVPFTTFWMVASSGAPLVGVSHLRHRLTAMLEKEGGHIGYTIAPSYRRQGLGSLQLALVLDIVREQRDLLEVDRVLITCDTDNVASAKIIRSNGGVFDSEIISDFTGKVVSRYWVVL